MASSMISKEQDQLDDLKAWWGRWGNTVATVLVVAALAAARGAGLALVEPGGKRRKPRSCSMP